MDYRDFMLKLISTFGYAGLGLGMLLEFIGVPFPGELALGFAGFMVWRGVFFLSTTLAVVIGFSWVGSIIAYLIGAHLGRPFLFKYGRFIGLTEKRLEEVETWFDRNRLVVLIFGRFISGVRPLSAYVAGLAKMSFPSFAIISFIGTSLWTSTFVFLGFMLGANWDKLRGYSLWFGVVFFILSVIVLFYFWRRYKRRKELNNEEVEKENENLR